MLKLKLNHLGTLSSCLYMLKLKLGDSFSCLFLPFFPSVVGSHFTVFFIFLSHVSSHFITSIVSNQWKLETPHSSFYAFHSFLYLLTHVSSRFVTSLVSNQWKLDTSHSSFPLFIAFFYILFPMSAAVL